MNHKENILNGFHICTENPCPLQDKECAEVLNNGFKAECTKEKIPQVWEDEKIEQTAKHIGIISRGALKTLIQESNLRLIERIEKWNETVIPSGADFDNLVTSHPEIQLFLVGNRGYKNALKIFLSTLKKELD